MLKKEKKSKYNLKQEEKTYCPLTQKSTALKKLI